MGLDLIAGLTDGLQVVFIIVAAFGQRSDVVTNPCVSAVKPDERELTVLQAFLASIVISLEYPLTLALPWPSATS